ncbi:tryptophan-rich sensory protein [Monashia sp. NPDC004114]
MTADPTTDTTNRTALVTGATGYIGGQLVPALLAAGWRVRVLTRRRDRLRGRAWASEVEVVEGDAGSSPDCERALRGVQVAYYLMHSMDGAGGFAARDRELAATFAHAAADACVSRIVYLSGLHPEGPLSELSDHLRSRVEVGRILLDSPVAAVVLQAGVVLGSGSASFDMLRHLTERLPAMVAPRWLDNRVQPIGVRDVVHYLVRSADLEPGINRAYDIGGPDVLTYREMMHRYARLAGLGPRLVVTVPVLTPRLAGLWVGLVTPLAAGLARPLVDSLIHDAVCGDDEFDPVAGPPPGGRTGFDDAVRAALREVDPMLWRRTLRRTAGLVGAAAVAGSLLTRPESRWYTELDTPRWQPPRVAFPVVWTLLYSALALSSAAASAELAERGEVARSRQLERSLVANLALNTGWSAAFFGARRPGLAAADAALLATSAADLGRQALPTGRGKAGVLGAYAAWCAFASVLTAAIARRNRG